MARGRKSNATKAKIRNANKNNYSGSNKSVDNMKYEIASEFGVSLGASASAKDNGRVGGEITKRLVEKAKNKR